MKDFKKLFSAFDYIDEVIYICDMETYDLVYCNRKLEESLMDRYEPNQLGYKCYKCLHGLDHPCVFCNNDTLRKDKRCIWSRVHPATGKNYLLHDALIEIDGKEYRMELAVDATHLEDASIQVRSKLEGETHLTDCIRRLVQSTDFSEAVSVVLQTILNYYNGARAYIFKFDYENQIAQNTYEICAPGVTAEIENLQAVPLENMNRWIAHFQAYSELVIEDLEKLKDNPKHSVEYQELAVQGIHSLIAVPIISQQGIVGCVGVDNPSLNFDNTNFMVNLAYFLGVEIGKNDSFRKLQDQSYRDPLTGVFNRKGFDEIAAVLNDNNPYGLIIADIDNFKMINDTYGHSAGDALLRETAHLLTEVFRSEDTVFRIGGDEFAVLLKNCSANAWNTICSKIQWVHTSLSEHREKSTVTLSAGICFAQGGSFEESYRIADEELYYVKQNGRAGCAMADQATGERKLWKDDSLSAYSRSVLNINNTGLYRIEYPLNHKIKPRMFCSSETREIFGFSANADAETCYQLWRNGIDEDYVEVLAKARQVLKDSGQVECSYRWKHPKDGMIYVRSTGIGEIENNIQILYGYHHSMKETRIVEKEDESRLLLEAISSIYFGSYYINLNNDTYRTIKYAPNERYLKVEEKDAQKSLVNFVHGLAKQDDHEKLLRFVDLSTIAERMKNETHLDCEYYAIYEKKWCRATFIPVKYHPDGALSHVLFEVAPLDYDLSREIGESVQNRKFIDSLYNHVPAGLVLLQWDGEGLKTLHASRYYGEIYGDKNVVPENGTQGLPNLDRVHPDDLPEFKRAIHTALDKTNHLDYVYRGYNSEKQDYVWIRITAVAEPQDDGTSLIYALFSDVTETKKAALSLAKKHESLVAVLGAFNQLCYEYDPVTKVEECLTDDRIFHMPRIVENYPEAIMDYIHPEDRDTLRSAISQMENGTREMSFTIRLLRDGAYVWYAYHLQSLYDAQRGYSVINITLMDNTEHMTMSANYRARMNIMLGLAEDALACGTVNLTQNTFELIQAYDENSVINEAKTLGDLVDHMAKRLVGEKEKREFRKLFSAEHLIEAMKRGQNHVSMDHLYHISDDSVEWLRTNVDMLVNPENGDIVGVCYAKSIQSEKNSGILLEMTLRHDYPLAAIAEVNSDRYYLYDSQHSTYGKEKTGFWEDIACEIAQVMDSVTAENVQAVLDKKFILKQLDENGEYSYSFNAVMSGQSHRMEARFYYADDSHETLVATLRDITDSVIMEQLRHDNERDHLTDLYNRRKIFARCKELLEEHPQERFAMLHFDIRHFRLYNTFFGDVAGDRLLCDIADMFRKMDKDYDYWAYGRIEADVFCVFFPIDRNKYQQHLDDLLHGLQDYRPDFLIEPAIGIYTVTDRTMSIESMFTRASIAAKTVRSGVTNSVIFYDASMEQALVDEQQVINDMRFALEQDQFHVYLQPQYSLKSKKPVGAEALVRWIHPQKGLISPAKFIPIFERNGFIANLDRYMWEQVCILLRKWLDEGKQIQPVSVNVSRISMYNPTTVQYLKTLVQKYRLDPKYLELELTESAYMDDPSEIKKYLKELREYGFHVLMDDFGSGYSSLNTLRELPVDVLKLDKEFLSESSVDERGRLVLSSVVQMSRLMNLVIIAEGVETDSQADFLRGLGVEYVQGYLFAKPMPIKDYEQLLYGN